MKTYARIARRRLEAALRITNRRRVAPVMLDPIELPAEVVDLASGPYQARFPGLANKRGKQGR